MNGERQKSSFLNNTRIELPETTLENGDVVTVSQVGVQQYRFPHLLRVYLPGRHAE